MRGDVYISRDSAQTAMHGDRVVVHIARIENDGRADGEIVKILRRAHATVVGEFRARKRGSYVIPHDDRIRQWIDIPDGLEIPPKSASRDRVGVAPIAVSGPDDLDGMIVNVEVLEFPEDGGARRRAASSRYSGIPTISASMSKLSSASITSRISFHPRS